MKEINTSTDFLGNQQSEQWALYNQGQQRGDRDWLVWSATNCFGAAVFSFPVGYFQGFVKDLPPSQGRLAFKNTGELQRFVSINVD